MFLLVPLCIHLDFCHQVVKQKFDKLVFIMEPLHVFGAKVFGSEIKSISDVPRCLRPKNLIGVSLDISVVKSFLGDFGRRSNTISVTSLEISGI